MENPMLTINGTDYVLGDIIILPGRMLPTGQMGPSPIRIVESLPDGELWADEISVEVAKASHPAAWAKEFERCEALRRAQAEVVEKFRAERQLEKDYREYVKEKQAAFTNEEQTEAIRKERERLSFNEWKVGQQG